MASYRHNQGVVCVCFGLVTQVVWRFVLDVRVLGVAKFACGLASQQWLRPPFRLGRLQRLLPLNRPRVGST